MTVKRKIGEAYVRYKLRTGIGQAYTGELEGIKNAITSGGILVILAKTYFDILLPLWVIIVAWAIQKAIEYALGYADEKYFHLTAYQNNYQAEHLNPHQKDIKDRLKDIQTRLPKSPLDF